MDTKRLIEELKQLEVDAEIMQRKIRRLQMEIEGDIDKETPYAVFQDVIKMFFSIDDPFYYVRQSDIFKHLCEELPKKEDLNNKCIKLGWKSNSPSNTFWRKLWQYIAGLPEIKRVVKSKNDIRFYGLRLKT